MQFETELEEIRKRISKEKFAGAGRRVRFSAQTRADVLRIAAGAKNFAALARRLGLDPCTLLSWLKKPTAHDILPRKLIVTADALPPKNNPTTESYETFDAVLKNGILLRGLPLNSAVLSLLVGTI